MKKRFKLFKMRRLIAKNENPAEVEDQKAELIINHNNVLFLQFDAIGNIFNLMYVV